MKKLYTITADVSATGEGRTMMAWIGYADFDSLNTLIKEKFGLYFSNAVVVKEGFDSNNECVKFLFTRDVISFIERNKDGCFLDLFGSIHFNFS